MTLEDSRDEKIFSLLNGLHHKLRPKFERCTGISSSRLEIMKKLDQVDEMNQTMLQKALGIDRAAITRHLKQLELEGMVSRQKSKEDNRLTLVRLSAEGRKLMSGFNDEKEKFMEQLLRGFHEDELNRLADYMGRLQNNL